jgi:hypothetical protein
MSMERLTGITENGNAYLVDGLEEDKYGYYTEKGYAQIDDVFYRLADYEDIGTVQQFVDLSQANEENARLKKMYGDCEDTNEKLICRSEAAEEHNVTLTKALERACISMSECRMAHGFPFLPRPKELEQAERAKYLYYQFVQQAQKEGQK